MAERTVAYALYAFVISTLSSVRTALRMKFDALAGQIVRNLSDHIAVTPHRPDNTRLVRTASALGLVAALLIVISLVGASWTPAHVDLFRPLR